jgi:hypothetical protein
MTLKNSQKNSVVQDSSSTWSQESIQNIFAQSVTIEFPHKAPEGYSYEQTDFKRNVIAIWILNHSQFSYCGNRIPRSIWGFYNLKTKSYYAPINSKTVGKQVRFEDTTPYSAMQLKQNPLIAAFV